MRLTIGSCAVQGVTWYWLHGAWVPFGGAAALSAPTLSNLGGILFSVGYRGWISWSPIVLPALVGLVLAALLGGTDATRARAIAWVVLLLLTLWNLWLLFSYELLIIRHDFHPTLVETVRYAVGLGVG